MPKNINESKESKRKGDNLKNHVAQNKDITCSKEGTADIINFFKEDSSMPVDYSISGSEDFPVPTEIPIFGEISFLLLEYIVYLTQYLEKAKSFMFASKYTTISGKTYFFEEAVNLFYEWFNPLVSKSIRNMPYLSIHGKVSIIGSLKKDTLEITIWLIQFLKIIAEDDEKDTIVETADADPISFQEAVTIFENWIWSLLDTD